VGAAIYLWQAASANREQVTANLATAQQAGVERFERWMDARIEQVRAWAEADDTQRLVRQLLAEPNPTAQRLNTNEVQAAFRARFAQVTLVPDLPRTRNMKVVRRVIRAAWLGEGPGDLSTLVNPDSVTAIRGR
jgi:hypothetical protein